VILEDYRDRNMLYVGTEFGLFFSHNGGQRWTRLQSGLPTIQVRDLALQNQHDDLVLGTFGRGFYVLDDLEILRALTPEVLAGEGGLLPITRTPMFVLSNPDPGWQGARFWSADNPSSGATFYYYVKEGLRTRQQRRQSAERAAAGRGEDVFYPPWDSLRAEDREERPAMVVTVSDAEGRVVRRLTGSVSSGLQRVTWDLRYPASTPIRSGGGGGGFGGGFFFGGGGPYIVPGTYTVSLATLVDGVLTPFGAPQDVEVYPLDQNAARTPAVLAFQQQAASLQRAALGAGAALGEATTRVELLGRALQETPRATPPLFASLMAVRDSLRAIQESLSGDRTMGRRSEPEPTSLQNRLGEFTGGAWSGSLQEITGIQRRQYEILAAEFGGLLERIRRTIDVDLKRVEDAAEAAGAPWTSGRIPTWRP